MVQYSEKETCSTDFTMIYLEALDIQKRRQIRQACAYLFAPQLAGDEVFIKNLKLSELKSAFRNKAKRYHPDFNRNDEAEMILRRKDRFVKIRKSYEILSRYLQEEDRDVIDNQPGQATIIAVGGAKGGIGKSLFAANLSVLLATQGSLTVALDLDLGGANLHLYLGETSLKWNINDFFENEISDLKDIMTVNRYGPKLIGGESSQLGAANINFQKKLKLMRAIRKIEADYVIIDLGGDTSYNIIDFYLLADYGIVMTTCDPASYLDAYSFIKTALYRKLTRLFGPESAFRSQKDPVLEEIIKAATMSTNGLRVNRIDELLDRVKVQQPQNLPLIKAAISAFSANLIINRAYDQPMAQQVVKRIQTVSARMLSIGVKYLGNLPHQPEIEASARDLVPIVTRFPQGDLVRDRMGQMVDDMLSAA